MNFVDVNSTTREAPKTGASWLTEVRTYTIRVSAIVLARLEHKGRPADPLCPGSPGEISQTSTELQPEALTTIAGHEVPCPAHLHCCDWGLVPHLDFADSRLRLAVVTSLAAPWWVPSGHQLLWSTLRTWTRTTPLCETITNNCDISFVAFLGPVAPRALPRETQPRLRPPPPLSNALRPRHPSGAGPRSRALT